MRFFAVTIYSLLLLSLAHRVHLQSDDNDKHAYTSHLGNANIGPDQRDRVKRNEDTNVDLRSGSDENNEVNQDDEEGSGQYENNSSNENEVSNEEGETDGNVSDDEESGDEEVERKTQKQKRHMMDTYIPDDGELQKMMSESSDLAKEVGQVFELLSDREVKLLREMEMLKDALNMAVSKLKTSLQAEVTELDEKEKARRQRRDFGNPKPYKACVSIEPSSPNQQYIGLGQIPPRAMIPKISGGASGSPPPLPPTNVREFIPRKGDPIITPTQPQKRPISPPPTPPGTKPKPQSLQGDQVDLSQVVWLRLHPDRKQEELKNKVDSLLKDQQKLGKDVLVIPVNHNLRNTAEVKTQFLHAVRVKPTALNNHNFRQLRSLDIKEY